MAFLGLDFIISSLLWLIVVFGFIFLFRKQIMKLFYGKTSFDLFINRLKEYLKKTYPDINFNFDIIELSKSQPNPQTRKYMIVDNIIDQYQKIKIDSSKYPQSTPKQLQWGSYVFNSEPNRDKLPKDWLQRKSALLTRDHQKCFRCSKKLTVNKTEIQMIRDLKSGGKYFLENLIPVCKDCYKLLNIDTKKLNHLDIKDDLLDIANR